MDGMQATEKIIKAHAQYVASDKSNKDIPAPIIIAVTAFKNQDSKSLALANGMNEILFKPLGL